MALPFSGPQFLDVFASYNMALWPVVTLLWLVSAALAVQWLRGRASDRFLAILLAAHWLWAGLLYHLMFFSRINPAARLFGAVFIIEALALAWAAVRGRKLVFERPRGWHGAVAALLVAISLAYPFTGLAFGLNFPRMPTFGVPCPTALLTVGLLVSTRSLVGRLLLVVPVLWCIVGSSAALLLGIRADLALALAAVAGLVHLFLPRAQSRVAEPRAA
jgi:hypothetical protein